MRFTVILLFLFFGFSACTSSGADDVQDKDEIDPRFQPCYHQDNLAKNQCDSVVKAYFGKGLFSSAVKFNKKESYIGCQGKDSLSRLQFGNESCCHPNTYDLVYEVRLEGEMIFQFTMIAGSDMKFEFVSPLIKNQLEGYKRLLAKELKYDFDQVKLLMRMRGMKREECMIELVRDTLLPVSNPNGYYWEIDNGLDGKAWKLLVINAMTGKEGPEVGEDTVYD